MIKRLSDKSHSYTAQVDLRSECWNGCKQTGFVIRICKMLCVGFETAYHLQLHANPIVVRIQTTPPYPCPNNIITFDVEYPTAKSDGQSSNRLRMQTRSSGYSLQATVSKQLMQNTCTRTDYEQNNYHVIKQSPLGGAAKLLERPPLI